MGKPADPRGGSRPTVLVLASTYPRWRDDPEPGFVHELCKRMAVDMNVIALVPDAPGADPSGSFDGVDVVRYRYAPRRLQTLVNDGGIVGNLRRSRWKFLLVPVFVVGQWWAARCLVRTRRVDAIHAHWLVPQGWIARWLSRRHRIPYLVTSHGGDLFGLRGRLLRWIKRQVARDASAMTVVSTAMRDEVERQQLRSAGVEVIPMGVELQHRFVPRPQQAREADLLLFVGRLVAKKGLRHLLDALPIVASSRPAIHLLIAGFGPEEPALRAQARSLGVDDRITFLGALPQSALPDLYHRASIFVAPFVRDDSGNQEGLPVVLMEAIGCGCPAIVGKVAGIEDLLGPAMSRLAVEPTDHERLAQRIVDTLDAPDRAATDAREVRDVALRQVDWAVIARRYTEQLQLLVAGSSADRVDASHGTAES